MKRELSALIGGMSAELNRLRRSRLLIALVLVQAVTFLLLVTLFGMTGAFAPTIVVNYDNGPLSQAFINNLQNDHHSFALTFMNNATTAKELVEQGKFVALIVIPQGFSQGVQEGGTVPITVFIDNLNTDMTSDIQRALPSAIMSFGDHLSFQDLNVSVSETDVYPHDTSFISYMIASALVLNALIIAGTLSALSVAEEFETKTAKLLVLSPVHQLVPMIGRVMTTALVSAGALVITVSVALVGYGISPVHPLELLSTLLLCIAIFSCIGAALGAVIKKTLPVAMLILGIALPMFLFSGSYEPERFDGNLVWMASHLTPEYYAVGLVENAVFNLKVTPEPLATLALVLGGFGIGALFVAGFFSRRGFL